MSEPINKPNEGAPNTATVDPNKFVPKEELDKVLNSKKELESKLDEAKLSLLDPEYIQFLESKKGKQAGKAVTKAIDSITDDDIEHLSSKQLLELAVSRSMEAVSSVYDAKLQTQANTISDLLAYIELQETQKQHPDFNDYRDRIKEIIGTSQAPLTYEQAYMIAKGEKPVEVTDEQKKKSAKTATEKPTNTVPAKEMQVKTFASKSAAAEDAWDQVVGASKDSI